MAIKKITLEEAKEILGTDKIFYNGNNKFNVLRNGRYDCKMTIEIPQEWSLDKNKNPEDPIRYTKNNKLTDGMNIDFNGDAKFLLGKYRLSQKGRPVFELTKPTEAKDALIEVSWGGAFNSSRGQTKEYSNEVKPKHFERRTSGGGGLGSDFWVLPVGFVKDMPDRDVSPILKEIENEENERIQNNEDYIIAKDLEIKNSINNKERVLIELKPIIEKIKEINPDFEYTSEESYFTYKISPSYYRESYRYSDEVIIKLNDILENEINIKKERDKYISSYKELENTLNDLDFSIEYGKKEISIKGINNYFQYKHYKYSQDDVNNLITDILEYQDKQAKEQAEIKRKAEELKRISELKIKKENAQKNNYPESFQFANRLSGAANLSHAYVVEQDGTIREPDENYLRNSNHKLSYSDWKNNADGIQEYMQILPGEIIVSYKKSCRKEPYKLNVEWADNKITEPQLDVLLDEMKYMADFSETIDGKEITDLEKWLKNASINKCKECRKTLKPDENYIEPEIDDDEKFAEEICKYATEKNKEEDKNNQACKLTDDYINQLKKQMNGQSVGDL